MKSKPQKRNVPPSKENAETISLIEEQQPKKKRSSKQQPPKENIPAGEFNAAPLGEQEAAVILKLLKDSVRFDAVAEEQQKQSHTDQKRKDADHLVSIISEYLGPFALMGFDLEGDKITIINSKSPMERDSIIEHMRKTFIRIMMENTPLP